MSDRLRRVETKLGSSTRNQNQSSPLPDFSISATVCDLNLEEMNNLRAMIVVGIGTMEDMWRREQERRAPAAQTYLESL